jgi:hypothetical protein
MSAQTTPPECGMSIIQNQLLAQIPNLKYQLDTANAAFALRQAQQNTVLSNPITVSVVVHVLYNVSSQNVSDATVQTIIDGLNARFAGTNPRTIPGVYFPSVTVWNTGISFCLASRDPNNNATTGIIHKHTSKTSFTVVDNDAKKSNLGGDDAWNTQHYYNIWIVPSINGAGGYAQIPEAPWYVDPNMDGVVLGLTSATAGTLAHETGHYFGLYHIFGGVTGGGCGDDYVFDTPTQWETSGCPSFPHISSSLCPGDPVDGDMFMNYMDYSHSWCQTMFTIGQAGRMRGFLDGNIRRTLYDSFGCVFVPFLTNTNSSTTICAGRSTTISIQNTNNIRSITWYVNGVVAPNWSGQTSITVTPNTTVTYTADIVQANQIGDLITDSRSITIQVNPNPIAVITRSFYNCNTNEVTLTASGGTTYHWSNGATTPVITVTVANTYTDSNSCKCGRLYGYRFCNCHCQ